MKDKIQDNKKAPAKRTARQNLALAGVILLAALYLVTFVLAFMKSETAQVLFRVAIACTFLVPTFLWFILWANGRRGRTKSPHIDSIVFDVGGVLVDFTWWEYIKTLGFPDDFLEVIFKDPRVREYWAEFDRGVLSFEAVRQLYFDAFPKWHDELDRFLNEIDKCLFVYPYTEELLRRLGERGYKLYILSNWPGFLYDRFAERGGMDFADLVDDAFWSYEHHLLKPDEAYFEKLINKHGIDTKRALFIDDMEKNTKAAEGLGFHAITFKDYQDLVTKLGTYDVRV